MSGTSLQHLEDAWLKHRLGKSRGLGGRRSLHGFRYQLALSLERFLDTVDAGGSGAATAFDGLSDLAYLEGDLVYLIQVKATLDRGRLREVADEALALDEFLGERFPDQQPKMRFRIWCRRRQTPAELKDLSAEELELDEAAARRWTVLRNRLESVEERADPYLSLVVRLFQQVADPFLLVDGWLGSLLRLLGEERPSAEIAQALLTAWQTERARLQTSPPGRLLQWTDVTETDGGETDILVGERPSLHDLGRGCFMPRPLRLGPVLHAVDSCLSEAREKMSRTVPVVWIRGVPGGGKRVLMLQAAAELTPPEEDHERATDLGRCFQSSRSMPEHAALLLARLDASAKALPAKLLFGWRWRGWWATVENEAGASSSRQSMTAESGTGRCWSWDCRVSAKARRRPRIRISIEK